MSSKIQLGSGLDPTFSLIHPSALLLALAVEPCDFYAFLKGQALLLTISLLMTLFSFPDTQFSHFLEE